MPPYINQELYPASIGKRLQGANRSFIRQIPLFRGLPPAQVDALLGQVESRFYQAGQTIIAQGAENRHIYFVQNGVSAVTYQESQFAAPEHYAYLKENDIFWRGRHLCGRGPLCDRQRFRGNRCRPGRVALSGVYRHSHQLSSGRA